MDRLKAISSIRTKLRNGGHSIGSWMQLPHPSVAEIMGQASFDWVAVDLEHGSVSASQLPDLFRALELGNTLPLARIAEGNARCCKEALDAGAGGIIVPMIKSALDLIAVRDACRWPPAGNRGVGFSRANLFGKHFKDYQREAQAPLLVAMIEHYQAVADLDSILEVEGLDAILVGPYDLSASMGCTAQFDHPDFCTLMETVRTLAIEKDIPVGVHIVTPSPENLSKRLSEGFRFLAYSIDAVMLSNASVYEIN